MNEVFDVLLDALIDTAKLLPIFLIVYLLIELLEYKQIFAFEKSKLLKGNAGPIFGALFGSIPQCGFSVVSSEMFAEKKISIGALVAVFVATSDEAIPIMLANMHSFKALLLLIVSKILIAIIFGYLLTFLYSKTFKNQPAILSNEESHHHIHACCNHDLEDKKFDFWHPVVHCLKISLYIFLFNAIFGLIIHFVGEDNFANFLSSNSALEPLFACIVGLIPNCASSVVLTELFLANSISFGSIVAGLSVNAGLGFIVLFKENKNFKENLFIVISTFIFGILIGYALHYLPINIL